MNGLERYGCQTIIYTPKNTFDINSPIFVKKDINIGILVGLIVKMNYFIKLMHDNDTLQFICDLFKYKNNMISYSLIKNKLALI